MRVSTFGTRLGTDVWDPKHGCPRLGSRLGPETWVSTFGVWVSTFGVTFGVHVWGLDPTFGTRNMGVHVWGHVGGLTFGDTNMTDMRIAANGFGPREGPFLSRRP